MKFNRFDFVSQIAIGCQQQHEKVVSHLLCEEKHRRKAKPTWKRKQEVIRNKIVENKVSSFFKSPKICNENIHKNQ